MNEIEEQPERKPITLLASWRPEAGESLTGQILRYTHTTTTYGWVEVVILRREEDRRQVCVWLTGGLKRLFKRDQPEVNDEITITYIGEKETRSGYASKAFTLRAPSREKVIPRSPGWAEGNEDDPFM